MRKTRLVLASLFLLTFANLSFAQADEKEAVKVPLDNYIKAQATGDGEIMKKALHTEGNMIWIREGKYSTRSFTEFIAGFTGKAAADEEKRKRSIESIDIAGNAASAKIILDYPAVRFVDYMTLLKIGGEWKIVSKVFYADPKAPPAGKTAK